MKLFLNFKYLFLIACLFVFIYSPPLAYIPLSLIKWLSIISIASLLLYFKKATLSVLKYKYVAYGLTLLCLAIFYAFIQDYVIGSGSSLGESNFYKQTLVLIEVFPIALFLNFYSRKYLKFSLNDLLYSLIVIGIIQSLLCLIMFLIPGIKFIIFNSILAQQVRTEKLLEAGYYGNFRGFGISIGYLFSFPVFQGLLIAFIFFLCLNNFKKYYYTLISIPLLFLSIILNARVGLVPIIVFFGVAFIVYLKNIRISAITQFVLISGVLIISVYAFFSMTYQSTELANNVDWILKSYTQNKAFLEGTGDQGTLAILLDSHIHFPKDFNGNLFGEGLYLFGEKQTSGSLRSDIGYILNLYFGGYVYSFLVYSSFCVLFWGALRLQKTMIARILIYFLLVVMLVVHLKGDVFWSNPAYRAAYLITLFPVVDRYIYRQEQRALLIAQQRYFTQMSTSSKNTV